MSTDAPEMTDEEAGEHLAKLRELRQDLDEKTSQFGALKRAAKLAKEEMDAAEFKLLLYLTNLDRPMPLFNGPVEDEEPVDVDAELAAGCAEVEMSRTEKALVEETFAALLSVGHGETEARSKIDAVLATGRVFDSVPDLIDAVYEADPDFKRGEAEGLARRSSADAEPWRSLPLVELAAHGLNGATASALATVRVDALGPLFDLADAGDLDTLDLNDDQVDEVLAAKRSFLKGPVAAPWRLLGIASLAVPGPVSGLLLDAGVKTLGDLAELLEEGGYSDLGLSRKWKTTVFEVERVRNALEAIRSPQDGPPDPEPVVETEASGRQFKPGEHPLPEHIANPAGPPLDRDVWLFLSSDRVRWENDSFYTNPVLKLPENVNQDLLQRAEDVIGRIGGEWAEDVKGYTFALVRCPDALAAVVKAKRAPTVWQDAPLSELMPPHAAKALAERCGIHTASQLDARVKTLHDQDVLAKAAEIKPDMMAEYIVALEDWIKADGRPAKGADPAKVTQALKRVEAIGRKRKAKGEADAAKPPAQDGLFLVYSGKGKTPVHCTPAPSLLDAIYFVKSQHPAEARLRVEPDDGTTRRLGLAIMTATAPDAPACTYCKDEPKTICPVCGKTAPGVEPLSPVNLARKPRRRKGDAEARP